jgi:hypothetical protein
MTAKAMTCGISAIAGCAAALATKIARKGGSPARGGSKRRIGGAIKRETAALRWRHRGGAGVKQAAAYR